MLKIAYIRVKLKNVKEKIIFEKINLYLHRQINLFTLKHFITMEFLKVEGILEPELLSSALFAYGYEQLCNGKHFDFNDVIVRNASLYTSDDDLFSKSLEFYISYLSSQSFVNKPRIAKAQELLARVVTK